MTPAIRRWLLSKAEEDLADAKEEEVHARRNLGVVGDAAGSNVPDMGPEAWQREIDTAGRELGRASLLVEELTRVVADLSSPYSKDDRSVQREDGPRVHILEGGLPLCGFSVEPPGRWPPGHKWVRRGEPGADCPACLSSERSRRGPDFVHHPGELVKEYLAFLGWSASRLAEIGRLPIDDVEAVCDGRGPITKEIAEGLALGFQGGSCHKPAHFWLALQANYDKWRAREAGRGSR